MPRTTRSAPAPLEPVPDLGPYEPSEDADVHLDVPEPPADLGDRGRDYWRAVVEDYELGPAELPTLGEVARTLDTLADLDDAVRTHGRITPTGKPSPLLVEQRQQRATLVRLLGVLDLPTEEQAAARSGSGASRAARRAARARWDRVRRGEA